MNKCIYILLFCFITVLFSQEDISGRISISSFANYSDGFENRNSLRLKPRVSFDANNIANSKFSLTGYINGDFRQLLKNDNYLNSHYIRVYDLAVKYDLNKSTSLAFGRKINSRLSNLGVIDGIQFNKSWENISSGFILGSRPDFIDFGLNMKLFEAGVYVGYDSKNKNQQTTLAVTQQMNGKSIDRRNLYITHYNRLSGKIRYYISSDVDLYEKLDGVAKLSIRLTGLYASLTYRPIKTLSLSTSYNSRKNIIYYETFKTFAERLYDDETRRGFKMRMNWKPIKYMYLGIKTGYRLKGGDDRSSYNYSAYLGHSNILQLHLLTRITISKITSNYLDGNIFDIYLSKGLFKNFLTVSTSYKYIDYYYLNNESSLIQKQISSDVSWQLKNKISFTLSYMGNFEETFEYNQVYFIISQRF